MAITGVTGRTNQKTRSRNAIVAACRELAHSGAEVTMPQVARRALVSEATAYRYFPDMVSLLQEALDGLWPVCSTREEARKAIREAAGKDDL